jgi:hypothetical protein
MLRLPFLLLFLFSIKVRAERTERTEQEAAVAARKLLQTTVHAELTTLFVNSKKPELDGCGDSGLTLFVSSKHWH